MSRAVGAGPPTDKTASINYHPIFLGTPEEIADKFQHWFEAGVGKGFDVVPDSGLKSLTDFVEQVVPILQQRGLLRT